MMRRKLILTLLGLGLLVTFTAGGLWWLYQQREARRTLVISVPPGTAAALATGTPIELFPRELELRLSEHDTLVVRNDDSEPITIGPYRVEPGQRFVQRYYSPGVFELVCSLHGDERLRIVVTR